MLLAFQQRLTQWDRQLYRRLSRWRTRPLFALFMRLMSASGDGYWYALTALVATFSLGLPWSYFYTLALAFAIERPVYWILKNSFRRDRPSGSWVTIDALLKAHDKFSFPSGHTCAAFLFAAISIFYFPALNIVLWLWACGVGISRVAIGVHYPTDVIAGACLGMALAELVLFIVI